MIEGLPSVLDPNDAVLWAPGPQERPLQAVILCLARPLAGTCLLITAAGAGWFMLSRVSPERCRAK